MIIEVIDGEPYKVVDGKCRDCVLRTGVTGACLSADACSRTGFDVCYAELGADELGVVLAAITKAGQP